VGRGNFRRPEGSPKTQSSIGPGTAQPEGCLLPLESGLGRESSTIFPGFLGPQQAHLHRAVVVTQGARCPRRTRPGARYGPP
jgi:hypothetical protein